MSTTIRIDDVHKTYPSRPPVTALRGVSLTVRAGERLAVLGPSGSGKSTLLNILGLLDAPTSGSYELLGADTGTITGSRRDRLRARTLGFVFQDYHVLGHRTVTENVELKLAISDVPRDRRPALVETALDRVGLRHRRHALGRLLSGGEKQRLALARAVVAEPAVLLADEPTGNLDDRNARNVLAVIDELVTTGVTAVVITHDQRLAGWADRAMVLDGGRIEPDPAT